MPLAQVGRIEYAHEEPILWRRNRDMSITVRADVVDGVQPPDVTNQIWPTLAGIRDRLEPGYRLEIGGAVEESAKGNASIFALFPLMIGVMLTLLMIQLQSFSRLILVFLTAPLGLIGASLALNLADKPFGFVALLGLIALAGMIMRNAVILVDQIETDVAHGSTRREAIVEATVRRARPVVLTGARGDPGDDPALVLGVLGADGLHDHGRALRRDLPDAAVPAGALCAVVPQPPRRARLRSPGRRGDMSGKQERWSGSLRCRLRQSKPLPARYPRARPAEQTLPFELTNDEFVIGLAHGC